MNFLVVIPAKGSSKDIPRKNIRTLNEKPLIFYPIKIGLDSLFKPDVYVTSEDAEVLMLASKFGAKTHKRRIELSEDNVTLDPVVYETVEYAEEREEKKYDIVITLQPTSPLLKFKSLDEAIKKIINNNKIDTILSGKNQTYLTWTNQNGKFLPNYETRLNKTQLPIIYRETGGFLITKRNVITVNNRIGTNVDIFLLNRGEDIDIENIHDWNLCEYLLKRKKILFVVAGNSEIGLGHVYNTLIIANDILNHQIEFLVDSKSELAMQKIKSKNYFVTIQKHKNILEDINLINPDIIINDRLDTSKDYIQGIKKLGIKSINFEDLGEGSKYADIVFNAIYSEEKKIKNHYFGHKYFILRDEFLFDFSVKKIENVKRVLITFGGVDPCNLTFKVLNSIYYYCQEQSILIDIVAGIGYDRFETLSKFENINIHKNVLNISNYMLNSDIIFTSAGRTVYEIASMGVPSIVLAQNNRELTHFFASEKNGFINMGLGLNQDSESILKQFKSLIESKEKRINANKLMLKQNLKNGRKKVIFLINNLIQSI